jgi:hypothetical protein
MGAAGVEANLFKSSATADWGGKVGIGKDSLRRRTKCDFFTVGELLGCVKQQVTMKLRLSGPDPPVHAGVGDPPAGMRRNVSQHVGHANVAASALETAFHQQPDSGVDDLTAGLIS